MFVAVAFSSKFISISRDELEVGRRMVVLVTAAAAIVHSYRGITDKTSLNNIHNYFV